MLKKKLTYFFACAAIVSAFGCGGGAPAVSPGVRPGNGFADMTPEIPEAHPNPDAVRLTKSISYDSSPCWAPDGTKIAYASYRDGAQNIMVLNLDYHAKRISPKDEPTKLTEGEFTDRDPSWAAGGDRILFASDRAGDFELLTVNFQNGELKELSVKGIQPRWSPAGNKAAFVYNNNVAVAEFNEDSVLSMVTLRGYNEFPSWSPDGSKIVFSSGRNIVSTDKQGQERRSLTAAGWNSHADWCHSRDRIVFVSNSGGKYNLWKMHSDGSNKVQLTDTPHFERFPRWSRDGRWVAFQADYEGSFDIWAIRVD